MTDLRQKTLTPFILFAVAWMLLNTGYAQEAGAAKQSAKADTKKTTTTTTTTTSLPTTPTVIAAKPDREKGSQPAQPSVFTLPEDWFWGEPIELQTSDGILLRGVFKSPRPPQTTTVLFVSDDQNSFFKAYRPLVARLSGKGYGIMALDTRGVGVSQTTVNGASFNIKDHITNFATYEKMIEDVKQMVTHLRKTKGVGPLRIVMVGSIVGANVAILAAADLPMDVRAVVALSPASNYRYLQPLGAAQNLGGRPLLAIASGGDNTSYAFIQELKRKATSAEAISLGGAARGHDLLNPDAMERVLKWVDTH